MSTVEKAPELPYKQRKFVEAYAVCRNGKRAYMEAYGVQNASYASVAAFRLIRNDNVRAEIRRLEQDALQRNGITQDRILQEIAALAFSDITQTEGVPIDALSSLPKQVRVAVRKAKKSLTASGYNEELELHPKLPALTLLAEMAGLIKKGDTNVQVNTDGNTLINFNFG